ncbi:MAG TPA: glycosyltransferase family 4 protein [Chitinophagales bacterium]|nr:glycosyltransferase family 4 protein [Chitinophagales bacterium]
MKILHITPEYPPIIWGGLGTAVGGLTKALAKEHYSVGVLLVGGALVLNKQPYGSWETNSMEDLRDQFSTEKIIVRENILFFHVAPNEAWKIADVLSEYWVPDIIHLHTAWLLPVAMRIRERCNCPIVFTVHSIDKAEYEVGKLFNHWQVQEQAIDESDRIIAISESEKEILAEYYPQAINKVSVAGNGIEDYKEAELSSIKREWKETELTILYTGRFVERKGIWDLIDAIPTVLTSFPKAKFVLAGGYGGGVEIEKECLVDTLTPFKNQVHFTGWLTPGEINGWYEKADMLVIPSWYEPFGMVVLEGMLYGLPIVATNIGGPSEILAHNVSAKLVPPKNPNALAESIIELSRNTSLRKRLGIAGAKEVRKKWLWEKTVRKIEQAYSEAAFPPLMLD